MEKGSLEVINWNERGLCCKSKGDLRIPKQVLHIILCKGVNYGEHIHPYKFKMYN